MSVNKLNLDNRKIEDLYKDLEEKLPFYTPEYSFDLKSDDFGVLLTKVFMKMFMGTISRYNQVPTKHYIEFLKMLNVTAKAPSPSIGPVVFNAEKNIFLSKNSKLLVKSDSKEEKTFELTESIQIIDSQIIGLYQLDKTRDIINDLYQSNETLKEVRVLDYKHYDNIQKHMFYINCQLTEIYSDAFIELYFLGKTIEEEANFIKLLENEEVKWQVSVEGGWQTLDVVSIYENIIVLKLSNVDLSSSEILGNENTWISCTLPLGKEDEIYRVQDIHSRLYTNEKIKAQIVFANDIQYEDDIYAFTDILQPYNCFYIGSSEVFLKRDSNVKLEFDFKFEDKQFFEDPEPPKYKAVMKERDFNYIHKTEAYIKTIVWEYWNGLKWSLLEIKTPISNPFTKEYCEKFENEESYTYHLDFICPSDINATMVNGVEQAFIRARIINISNHLRPYNIYKIPVINNLCLNYCYEKATSVEQIVKEENGVKSIVADEIKFHQEVDDVNNAIYICFDKKPLYGPINILIDVSHEYERDLSWWYISKTAKKIIWKSLNIIDSTDNFSQIGLVTFYGEEDISEEILFGKKGYWIRIVIEDNMKESILINGIYLNASWMKQQVTIKDEQLSNVKDKKNMTFKTKLSPVVNQEVWINEFNDLSKHEMDLIKNSEAYDIKSSDSKYWVKWNQVNDFSLSELEDRHYKLDENHGLVTFSDGTIAKKPSTKDLKNIRINYSVGGGEEGNFDAYSKIRLSKTENAITSIYNPLACVNGSLEESSDSIVRRGANVFFHRNKAISELDMEQQIYEYTNSIIKVKCYSQIDGKYEKKDGHVLLVLVLKESSARDFSFTMLSFELENHMKSLVSNLFSNGLELSVVQAQPIYINIILDVYIDEGINNYKLKESISDRLKQFFDLKSGGFKKHGWDIGQLPHTGMISNIIEEVDLVISIKSLLIDAYKESGDERISVNIENAIEPYSIIVEGKHDIKLSYF